MLCDIKCQTGFTHGRSGADHNHFRRLQPGGQIIQIIKTCRHTGNVHLLFGKIVNVFIAVANQVFDAGKIFALAKLGRLKNTVLGAIQ